MSYYKSSYAVNDIFVDFSGNKYTVVVGGNTPTTPFDKSNIVNNKIVWGTIELVPKEETFSGKGLEDWEANKEYNEDDVFVYENQAYKALVGFTSGSTFEQIEILEDYILAGETPIPWAEGTEINTNDIVEYNSNYYKALYDFTCGEEFTKTAFEEYVPKSLTEEDIDEVIDSYTPEFNGNEGGTGGQGISIWESNKEYAVNDVVIDSNLIWQCAVAHTSTSTFDKTKWICLSGGEISNGMEIVPLWEGSFNSSNNTNGADPTSSTPMIELNDNINNYEYIYVKVELSGGTESSSVVNTIPFTLFRCSIFAAPSYYASCSLCLYDDTHIYMKYANTDWSGQSLNVLEVKGIRKAKPIVSSGMKYETLWEGEAGSSSTTVSTNINLSEPITKYKTLGLWVKVNGNRRYYSEIDANMLNDFITNHSSDDAVTICWGYSNLDDYVNIAYTSTITQLAVTCYKTVITKIIGISEGVQIPTGVQAARVTLWEGFYNTSNNSHTITQTQEMSSMEGYDQIEVTIDGRKAEDGNNVVTQVFNISDIQYNSKSSIRVQCFATRELYTSFNIGFTDSTHFGIAWLDSTSWGGTFGITKITGIKYIQPDSYSTEEKLIGTWIDGKPLYRKVFTGLSIALQWNDKYFAYRGDISLPLSNVDTLVSANGYGDNFSMPVTIDINRTTNLFGIRGVDIWTINSLAVEYTKN